MEILARSVTYRNPYAVESLPAIARLHRAAWSPSRRMREEIVKLPLRPLFAWAYRSGLGGRGRLRLNVKGEWKTLPFDGRNLQFTCLYLPQHSRGYESETAALLDALVTSRAVFYDVGSNWGYYALWLAGREGFAGHVHAFEPLPSSFRDLQDLVTRAGLASSISAHDFGLSDATTKARMRIPDGLHSGLATVSKDPSGVLVALKRLDELDIAAPDVMKVDVEDHEARVLTGGRSPLEKSKPHIVFESVWGRRAPAEALAPFEFLKKAGYFFFHPAWVGAPEPGQPAVLALVPFEPCQRFLLREHLNVLACHKEKLPRLEGLFPLRGDDLTG